MGHVVFGRQFLCLVLLPAAGRRAVECRISACKNRLVAESSPRCDPEVSQRYVLDLYCNASISLLLGTSTTHGGQFHRVRMSSDWPIRIADASFFVGEFRHLGETDVLMTLTARKKEPSRQDDLVVGTIRLLLRISSARCRSHWITYVFGTSISA